MVFSKVCTCKMYNAAVRCVIDNTYRANEWNGIMWFRVVLDYGTLSLTA